GRSIVVRRYPAFHSRNCALINYIYGCMWAAEVMRNESATSTLEKSSTQETRHETSDCYSDTCNPDRRPGSCPEQWPQGARPAAASRGCPGQPNQPIWPHGKWPAAF